MKKIIAAAFILSVGCADLIKNIEDQANALTPEKRAGTVFDKGVVPDQVLKIRKKWEETRPVYKGNVFREKPSIRKPYSPGEVEAGFLQDGLRMTRFVRFVAGVPSSNEIDDGLCNQAQHGAVVLAATGALTHTPKKPRDMSDEFFAKAYKSTTSSNIHMQSNQGFSLSNVVRSFLDDSDPSNIDRLGHRRWILNPELKRIGFGSAQNSQWTFVTMQVFDRSELSIPAYDYISWPSKGWFPLDLFGAQQAWSISLNPQKYDLTAIKQKNECTVMLTRLKDGKKWIFGSGDDNTSGKYFNIETTGFGIPLCIIFRPNGIWSFDEKEIYNIKVSGLFNKNGEKTNIEYTVSFFNI